MFCISRPHVGGGEGETMGDEKGREERKGEDREEKQCKEWGVIKQRMRVKLKSNRGE